MDTGLIFYIATILGILGSALVAGTFFVFSIAIMRAFDALDDTHATAAMRSINRVIVNPWFLGIFLGTALISIFILLLAALASQGWVPAVVGSLLYVLGSFVVTIVYNVPLNDALETGGLSWPEYRRRWIVWNHVRTVASIAATAGFALSFAAQR